MDVHKNRLNYGSKNFKGSFFLNWVSVVFNLIVMKNSFLKMIIKSFNFEATDNQITEWRVKTFQMNCYYLLNMYRYDGVSDTSQFIFLSQKIGAKT